MPTTAAKIAPTPATTDLEVEACFDVMSELRTHLIKSQFLATIRQLELEGYKLACIKDQGEVVAVAGYRMSMNLFMGKNLYVEDLVTSAGVRSQGHGETMVKWLRDEAQKSGCNVYHLDSGTHRGMAHKFYFKQGFAIASYHFSEQLPI